MKNQKGFTLVEILITTAIVGGLVIVSMNIVKNQSKNEKRIQDSSSSINELTTTGTYFQQIASNAGLSQFFLHLPIKVNNCSNTDPCVRKLNTKTKKFENSTPSDLAGLKFVEFFQDSSAELEHLPIQNKNYPSGSLHLITAEGFNYIAKDNDNEFYTTWPLINESSPPFVAMIKDSSHYFTFTKELQKASTTSTPYHLTLMKSKSFDIDENSFKDKIFLTYSALNLKHYYVKQNRSFENCQKEKCKNALSKINLAFPAANLMTEPYYKFEFTALDTNSQLYKRFPYLNYAPTANTWSAQNGFLFFPHTSFSIINKNGMIGDFNPTSNVDIKALSHSAVTDQLITMPIAFVFYKLKKGPVKIINNKKVQSYQLIEEKYNSPNKPSERIMFSDITGKVYFARKLGSTTLSLIVEK